MATGAITLAPKTGDGKYVDVIEVAKALAHDELGTPANAIAVMCRESPRYLKFRTLGGLKRRSKKTA